MAKKKEAKKMKATESSKTKEIKYASLGQNNSHLSNSIPPSLVSSGSIWHGMTGIALTTTLAASSAYFSAFTSLSLTSACCNVLPVPFVFKLDGKHLPLLSSIFSYAGKKMLVRACSCVPTTFRKYT
jgi:hypothetical protein